MGGSQRIFTAMKPLCDTVMVDTRHYMFVQTLSMYGIDWTLM